MNIQKAIEHGPVEIVDFPMKNGDFPLQNVSSPEGIPTDPRAIGWPGHGQGTTFMKNWEPPLLGCPVLAMLRVPGSLEILPQEISSFLYLFDVICYSSCI